MHAHVPASLSFFLLSKGTLRDEGLSVWYADPNDDPSNMGNRTQAILACKVSEPMLTLFAQVLLCFATFYLYALTFVVLDCLPVLF